MRILSQKHIKYLLVLYMLFCFYLYVFKSFNIYEISDRINSFKWNKELGANAINLTPFNTLRVLILHIGENWALKNILASTLVLTPFGLAYPIVIENSNYLLTLGFGILFAICIEFTRYYLCLGSIDIDDIILNAIGCSLGYLFYLLYSYIFQRKFKK